MQERRSSIRFNAPFAVDLIAPESTQEASGVIKDVNYAGARIVLDNFLDKAIAESIFLFIRFPEDSLQLDGKVIWAKDLGDKREVGLSFVNIRDADKGIIYNRIFKYYKQEFVQRWWQ